LNNKDDNKVNNNINKPYQDKNNNNIVYSDQRIATPNQSSSNVTTDKTEKKSSLHSLFDGVWYSIKN